MNRLVTLLGCVLLLSPLKGQAQPKRIVSAGGAVTETLYTLGLGDRIVGVDQSSTYPEEATKLPQIGYVRALSAEGILSLHPDLFVSTEDAGPPGVIEQLKGAGLKVLILPSDHTETTAVNRIVTLGKELGAEEQANRVVEEMRAKLELARKESSTKGSRPRVLFLYCRGGSMMNVSGAGTAADAMLKLAGAENVVNEYEGYKPLTPEAAVKGNPDVILVTAGGVAGVGGIDRLLEHPALALTKAGRERKVVAMDDLFLLGFGPRLGDSVHSLHAQLREAVSGKTAQ
jgi:iron complex transport system substrate-binding protein